MKLGKYVKASADNILYTIDYSQWLGVGETVSNIQFNVETVTTPALAVNNSSISSGVGPQGQLAGTMVSFYVSLGLSPTQYTVTVTITTSLGQTKEDYIYFFVQDPP